MGNSAVIVSALLLLVALGVLWKSSRQYRLGRMVERNGGLDVDIDAVRGKPYAFRLFGDIHVVNPMSVEDFINVTSAAANMGGMFKKKNTKEELIEAYSNLFKSACPTITKSVVEKMNHAQIAQLYNAILEILAGKAHIAAEKKNSLSKENHPGLAS